MKSFDESKDSFHLRMTNTKLWKSNDFISKKNYFSQWLALYTKPKSKEKHFGNLDKIDLWLQSNKKSGDIGHRTAHRPLCFVYVIRFCSLLSHFRHLSIWESIYPHRLYVWMEIYVVIHVGYLAWLSKESIFFKFNSIGKYGRRKSFLIQSKICYLHLSVASYVWWK